MADNRIDALANKLQKENKIDTLESELLHFNPEKLNPAEMESWYHLYGIAAFRKDHREQAFERFSEGLRHCPNSAQLLFSLGQEYEFRSDIDEMINCFDKAMFPKVPASYALAEARYAYLWNKLDHGYAYVDAIVPTYLKLKILDSTFLYLRGIPFFQQSWSYLAAFSKLKGNFDSLLLLTEKVKRECSDLDFELLDIVFAAIRTDNNTKLKEVLIQSIEKSKAGNYPIGYQSLQLTILLAQESTNRLESIRSLDSVQFSSNDFRWLDDMRLLAKCEQASGFDTSIELSLQSQFLERQPLLFEPDNCINFNLLNYQEKLKELFRKKRKST